MCQVRMHEPYITIAHEKPHSILCLHTNYDKKWPLSTYLVVHPATASHIEESCESTN
jgi:hypothetical protein